MFLGRRLGDLAFQLIKKRREITIANLEIAFPEREARPLARASFQHLGCVLIDTLCLPYLISTLRKWILYEGMEVFERCAQEQQGVLLLTAHFGSWEVIGLATKLLGLPMHGLYQRQTNPFTDDWFYQLRANSGLKLIEKKSGLRARIKEVIVAGDLFGLVGDQGRGQRIEFFGKETDFPKWPATLALKHGTPIYFTVCIREGNFLKVKVLGEVSLLEGDTEEEIVFKTSKAYARLLEDLVRKYPEQYFWVHDMWRLFK